MDNLTVKQQKILNYISDYSADNSFPPTLKEIAKKFGVTIGTIQDHVNALKQKGHLERKRDIARGFRVVSLEKRKSPSASVNLIPIYGNVAAGGPILATENIQGYVTMEKVRSGHHIHFALKVKGESMIDSGIYDGDIVIVRKQDSAEDGDIVIALIEDEATVKTLRNKRIHAYLEASNSRYKSIIDKPFQVIGKVIELRRAYAQK